MPYDENFYHLYRKYLNEPIVRQNHNHIFSLFASLILPEKPQVIDLGCGIGEYPTFDLYHANYTGIDLNNTGKLKNFIQADYTALDFQQLVPFAPNAFISLFSIECCNPANSRYVFYEKLFSAFSALQYGLAGGFFYESRRHKETISETGDIVSYQSTEDPALYISNIFTELRVHLQTPSVMFGPDVIEVWKILIRK
jgi:hypothetical protein